ncbi:MAG: hypothetical protein IJZ35_00765 [Clostridia bacterium]|nr:hypothetical protein [Clostridia bacterium]
MNKNINNKYFIIIVLLVCILFLFTACTNETDTQQSATSEELASVLADTDISNSDKADKICNLANAELARANDYKDKIKSAYKETVDSFSDGYQGIGFSIDSAYQSIDDYCEYLENEFSANIEFFENLTAIKYHSGSAGAIFLAEKEYECAKSYADKLEDLYNDLIN